MEWVGFSDEQRAWLEERAPLEGVDQAELLRLVVDHAILHMPPGWRRDTDATVVLRRAHAEAETVARRLGEIEAEQPGYVERLGALPQEQQTEQIRREVYPEATTAWLPPWAFGLGPRHVVVPYTAGAAAVRKILTQP